MASTIPRFKYGDKVKIVISPYSPFVRAGTLATIREIRPNHGGLYNHLYSLTGLNVTLSHDLFWQFEIVSAEENI